MTVVGVERARAASTPVTIFLERNGRAVSDDVKIPRFGGGDRAWRGIVGCVREHYAPFQVEVVDHKPARGKFITAVVGGRASQLGLDDRWTNGVGPHTGRVIPSAIVFVFSKVGTGERDVANLCAVTAHEVAHALGLDHSFKCGDIMSYWLDRCGTRRFMDFDAPCGEDEARKCAGGARTQNSYRRLGALVGFRSTPAPEPEPEPAPESEPESELEPELEPALEPELEPELEVDVDVDTDFRDDMDRDVDDMDVGRDVGPADPYREDDGDEDAYDDDAYDDNAYDDDAYGDDAPAPRSRAPNRAPNRARNRLRSTEPQRPSVGHCGRRRS